MKLDMLTEHKQPLLHRTSYMYKVTFDNKPTPSEKDMKQLVVAALKTKEDLVVLNGIHSHYGGFSANVYVEKYDNAEAVKTFAQVDKKKNRNKPAEEKKEEVKAEATPQAEVKKEEASKTEVKAEEKTEAPKAEEKSEDKKE